MSIAVIRCSPEVVGPAEPGFPTGNIHLSWFDKAAGSVAMSSLLVFDKPIVDPAATIRRALSRALVHYYPISGRLSAGADGGGGGDEVITLTGDGEDEGVVFVAASASGTVEDVLLVSSPALLNELLLHYPEEYCSHGDALLLMQVTEFSCGGFAVGVTWNHVVADGAGIAQFLQAVGELARGMPAPSVVPARSDESVLAARPRGGGMGDDDFRSAQLTEGMAFLDLTVPSSYIGRVKAALGAACTVFEVVVALLWQCRARAVAESESPATLAFSSDVCGLVGAARGYYGNCLIMESVEVARSGEVAEGEMKDLVQLIQSGKKKIEEKMKKGDVVVVAPAAARPQLGYNTLMVSSWRNLGLEAADFGGGRPARVMWYEPQFSMPFVVICPSSPSPCKEDGVNVLGYIVKKEHVDAFMREIDRHIVEVMPHE